MKTTLTVHVIALTLLAALMAPVQLAAQEKEKQDHPHQHHHYKLIDMGTFGGPQSYVTFPDFTSETDVNNNGIVAGWADTAKPDPYPNFCFWDCYVVHTFQWRKGVRSDLGTLPGGASSQPAWVSASGLITGWSQNGEIDPLVAGYPENRAVLWKNGHIRDLGVLPEGGYESLGFAVNSSGLVVGLATNTIPDAYSMFGFGYQARAFLWSETDGMRDLGTLPGGTDAQALLVNQRGQVMGWSYTSSTPSSVCSGFGFSLTAGSFLWDRDKGMTDLGGFGGSCTVAYDLNNQGQTVGYSWVTGDQFERAFLSENGSIQDLGGSLGSHYTGAFAVNDSGQAVGFGYLKGDALFHATLWRQVGQITDLGTLGQDACSSATDINAQGQIIGGSMSLSECGGDEDFTRAFLWEDGGIVDLNTLIPPGSALYLLSPDTINDRGEIAGTGVNGKGDEHAFLLIPCDENHPNVEGCDYSLVDATAASRVSTPLHAPNGAQRGPQRWRTNRHRSPGLVKTASAIASENTDTQPTSLNSSNRIVNDALDGLEIRASQGTCVVSEGKLTGRCVENYGLVCLSGKDILRCPVGQKPIKQEETQCGVGGRFEVDAARQCTP